MSPGDERVPVRWTYQTALESPARRVPKPY